MPETASAWLVTAARRPTLVALLAMEVCGDQFSPASLHAMIANADFPVRILILVNAAPALAIAVEVARLGIQTELLLAENSPEPPTDIISARLPADTKTSDRDDLALALSDVVLIDPAKRGHGLVHRAEQLGKPLIGPGHGLPPLPSIDSVTRDLDPQALGRFPWRRHIAGRFEQMVHELLAFRPFAGHQSFSERSKGIRRCLRRTWSPTGYFAPNVSRRWSPDPKLFNETSPLIERFEALDRSAVLGAYVHRDLAWATHFGAAFAVLFAVVGILWPHGLLWPIVELILLVLVALSVFLVWHLKLQDRWTACRLGAEQLRIARMCLPLLVLQRALISEDTWPGRTPHGVISADLTRDALSEVKRAVRDHGLPPFGGRSSARQAARWLECIVTDQLLYHQSNHQTLERAEHRLRFIAGLLFFGAMLAVLITLGHDIWPCLPGPPWLLLVTAAGPAFAAACHGTATRLAIVHRVALSQDVERDLRGICNRLGEIMGRPEPHDSDWQQIRALAFEAAEAMGRENRSWHSQVRLQRDTLPA